MARSFMLKKSNPRTYKKRRFLTAEQRQEAVRLHFDEKQSLASIARSYGVSITPIQRAIRLSGRKAIRRVVNRRWTDEEEKWTGDIMSKLGCFVYSTVYLRRPDGSVVSDW